MNYNLECVDVLQGNDFTLNLYVTHYNVDTKVEEPYVLDAATDVFVRFVGNNGCVRKFTDLTITDNIISCNVDGARLKAGTYGLEVCFKIDGNDKRSYRCCMIKVHNCECSSDIDTLSQYDIAVAFGADNQVINVGGLVYAHVDDHLSKSSENPVQNKVITNALDEYATKDYVLEVVSGGEIDTDSFVKDDELAEILTSYVTNSQLQEAIDNIPQPDLSSYATIEYVDKKVAEIPQPDLSNYYNKQEVDNIINSIPETDLSNYYNKQEIDNKFDNIPDIDTSSYVTRQELAENNFAYSLQVSDLMHELIDDERVIATHGHKIEQLTSYFPSYATIEYVNSVVAGGDIDLSSYVTKQELSDANFAYYKDFSNYTTLTDFNESVSNLQNQIDNIEPSVDLTSYVKKEELSNAQYAYKSQVDELKNDVIDDELVLAHAVHDIQTLNSYLTSYVKRSEYNELVNSYNMLYLTMTYLLQNVQWAEQSETPEQFTVGYIFGTTSQGFNSFKCEAFPSTYFSAPSFKVEVPNGRLTGSAKGMFSEQNIMYGNSYITSITAFDVDTSTVTDTQEMFFWCVNLASINFANFNTSHVTTMTSMFNACRSLTKLNLSSFDTSNVTNMNNMFANCNSLTSLDLHSFNTSKVRSMSHMFCNCSALKTLDISHFDLSSIVTMENMFNRCDVLRAVYVDNMKTKDIETIRTQLQTDIGYKFILSVYNDRQALVKTSSRVVNINL